MNRKGVSYDTGTVIAAEAQNNSQLQLSGLVLFLFLMVTPIYWLEFFAYSLAVEESISVIISIGSSFTSKNKKLIWTEGKWLIGSVVAVIVVLFFSARLESSLVAALTPTG